MLKKIISYSVMCLIVFGLVGCGNTDNNTEVIELTEKVEITDTNNSKETEIVKNNNINISKVTKKEEKTDTDNKEVEKSSVKGTVLLDCDEVTITIDELLDHTDDKDDPWAGYYITIQNKTDKTIYITTENGTVNGKSQTRNPISSTIMEPNSIEDNHMIIWENNNINSLDDLCNIEFELTIGEYSHPDYEIFNIYNISIDKLQ